MKLENLEPVLRTTTDHSWLFTIIMVILILLAASRFLFSKHYALLGNLNLYLEGQENNTFLAVFTNLILAMLIGVFIYPYVDLPFVEKPGLDFANAMIFVAIIAAYFLLRYVANLILVYAMGLQDELQHIIKVKIYFRTFAIFAFILLNLLLYYSEFDKNILFFIGASLFLIQLILEYMFQLQNKSSRTIYKTYYFILYLCTLEILPILYVILHWNR